MQVIGIYVHPLKSARAVALTEAQTDAFGLQHDRRWAVCSAGSEADGNTATCVTQAKQPRLALIQPELTAAALRLTATDHPMGELLLPYPKRDRGDDDGVEEKLIELRHEDMVGAARHCGQRAAEWISTFLQAPSENLFIACFEPSAPRCQIDNPAWCRGLSARIGFQDLSPLLVTNAASLAALNAHLPSPVPMDRFRANIVLGPLAATGSEPVAWDEDFWAELAVGSGPDGEPSMVLRADFPCARCSIPTIDQTTAQRTKGYEPTNTLRRIRAAVDADRFGTSPLFGAYFSHGAVVGARIAVGDRVVVRARSEGAVARPGDGQAQAP
eukprot:TRINITY_DN6949_c0_g1_i2.p1 TRINITY_DN6949_c0_g1~~TRINITY_DN6949_c0_g1_i2.p1  ORF type:complete len:328 (-),score=47.49 TRINITY_DN6949_c0_g1_i2:610-1593(-)